MRVIQIPSAGHRHRLDVFISENGVWQHFQTDGSDRSVGVRTIDGTDTNLIRPSFLRSVSRKSSIVRTVEGMDISEEAARIRRVELALLV